MAASGTTASILDVAQAGVYLAQELYAVVASTATPALPPPALPPPHNIHRVAGDIALFVSLLKHAAAVFASEQSGAAEVRLWSAEAEELVGSVVGECEALFREVEAMLGENRKEDHEHARETGQKLAVGKKKKVGALQRVLWCFEQPRVQWLLARLDYLKITLSVLLQVLNLAAVTAQVRGNEMREGHVGDEERARVRQERVHVETLVMARQLSLITLKQHEDEEAGEESGGDESEEESDDGDEAKREPKFLTQASKTSSTVLTVKRRLENTNILDEFSDEQMALSPILRHSTTIVDRLLDKWALLSPPDADVANGKEPRMEKKDRKHTSSKLEKPMIIEETKKLTKAKPQRAETMPEQSKNLMETGLRLTESNSSLSRRSNHRTSSASSAQLPQALQTSQVPKSTSDSISSSSRRSGDRMSSVSSSQPPPPLEPPQIQSKQSSLVVSTAPSPVRTISPPQPSTTSRLHINKYATHSPDLISPCHQSEVYIPVELAAPDYILARSTSRASRSYPQPLAPLSATPRSAHPISIAQHNQRQSQQHARIMATPLPPKSNYRAPFISDGASTISSSSSTSSSSSSPSSRSSSPITNGHRHRHHRHHQHSQHGLGIPWRVRVLSSSAGLASGRYFDFLDAALVGPSRPFLPPNEALERVYSDANLRPTAKDPGAVTEIATAWVAERALGEAGLRYSVFVGVGEEPPAPLDGYGKDGRVASTGDGGGEKGWRIWGSLSFETIEALVEHTIALYKESQNQASSENKRNSRSDHEQISSHRSQPTQQPLHSQRPPSSYMQQASAQQSQQQQQPQSQQQQSIPSRHRSVSFSNGHRPPSQQGQPQSQPQLQQQPPIQNQPYFSSPMVQSPPAMGGPQQQSNRQSMYGGNLNGPAMQNTYFPLQQQQSPLPQYGNQQPQQHSIPGALGPHPLLQQQQQAQQAQQANTWNWQNGLLPHSTGPPLASRGYDHQQQPHPHQYQKQQQYSAPRDRDRDRDRERDRERSYSPPKRKSSSSAASKKERRERREREEEKESKKKKNSAAGTIARLGGLAALLEGFDAL